MGGEQGNQYTAQLLVAPPNERRSKEAIKIFSFLMSSDVNDIFDYDDSKLDFMLLTTDLFSYDDRKDYDFHATNLDVDLYEMYRQNTIGYLEKRVEEVSGGEFNAIRLTWSTANEPQYIFVDGYSPIEQLTSPRSYLYQPVLVRDISSKDAKTVPIGTMSIKVNCIYSLQNAFNSYIDPYEISGRERIEHDARTRVPISEGRFEYLISDLYIDVVSKADRRTLASVKVARDLYELSDGILYFKETLEDIVFGSKAGYNRLINPNTPVYYEIRLIFPLKKEAIGSENEQGMIISQATHYALMEYMKQYYFAKTAGQMLAEMRYVKEITFWSTVISAPAVALGSLWTKAHREASNKLSQEAVKFSWKQWVVASAVGATYGAVQEVLEELMVDPIIEEWIRYKGENDWNWNPKLIYWMSTMATSARESMVFGIVEHYMESAVSFMQKKAGIQVDEKLQLELKAQIAERTGLDEKSQEFQKIFGEEMSKARQANLEKMAKFEKGKNIALAIGLGTLGILAPDLFLSGLNAFVGFVIAERAYKSVSVYLKASRVGRITKRVKAVFYKDANVDSKMIEDKLEKTVSTIISTDVLRFFNLDPKNSYHYFIKELTSDMNSLEAYGYQIQFEGDSKLKNLVYKELRERTASRIQLEFE
ncbi:MAG: hypothetical protein ACTSWE_14605 [Promethearchaeota archaeon]